MLVVSKTKCRRCGGTLSLERDEYGAYVTCIQCGAVWNQADKPAEHPAVDRQAVNADGRPLVGTR